MGGFTAWSGSVTESNDLLLTGSETSRPSKNYIRICPRVLELSAEYGEFPLFHNGKISFRKFLHPEPDPDNFQNFTVNSSSKDTSLVKKKLS